MASTAVADANAGGFGVGQVLDGSNPAIVRLRQLVDGPQSSDGWRRCWEQGVTVTPWDLGEPTPAVVKLVQSGTLPAGGATVLVPGCGGGYELRRDGPVRRRPLRHPEGQAAVVGGIGARRGLRQRRLLHLGAAGAIPPHLRLHILLRP